MSGPCRDLLRAPRKLQLSFSTSDRIKIDISSSPVLFCTPLITSRSNLVAELQTSQSVFVTMISDRDLFSLAVFFGVVSVLLIVLYHFLEANTIPNVAGANKVNHAKAS
ncbi:hypothetical protein E4U21_000540 [Claviceps maximensis]|nr:hypothetical protein E4U21_000540 [Claviceps maximensis]